MYDLEVSLQPCVNPINGLKAMWRKAAYCGSEIVTIFGIAFACR